MRRLRVAVYHDLGPGGALRALDELLRRLSTDHDCDLFETVPALEARARAGMELGLEASCRDHHTFALADPPARGLKLGPAHILRQVWQLDRAEATVAEAIDAGGYDLAYVHPCHVRYTPAILRMLRTPVVFTMQEARRPSFEYRARRRRHESWRVGGNVMTRSVMTLAGEVGEAVVVRGDRRAARTPGVYVVCNSAFSAERILASYGIQAHVSYLGVDPERFRPSAGAPVSPTGGPFVVAVGRFVPSKRHDLVIEALARIPSRDRPAFVIVGEGPGTAYEDGLVSLAEGRGVDLRLRRSVDDDALVHLYRDAVATVCASELEPFGLTALESIACGTPVVAVNEGGFRESVVDGVTGVLVDAGVHGLEDGITRVLADRTRFDPDALATSIRSGGWTWDDAAARVEARFASALGGG